MSRLRSALPLIAAILSPLLGLLFGRLAAPLLGGGTTALYLFAGGLEALTLGLPALLLLLRKRTLYRPLLAPPPLETAGLVSLSAVSYVLTAVMVTLLWMGLTAGLGMLQTTPEGMPRAGDAAELAAALLCGALLPALCEEMLFRGVLLLSLERRMKAGLAVFLSALLFSLLHFSPRGFAALLVIGLFLGALVLRCRNLWLAVLFHFLYNATVIVMEALGGSPSPQTALLCAGIFLATTYLLFKRRRTEAWN